jgi:DNA-binding CsgD family transcriptional regulator
MPLYLDRHEGVTGTPEDVAQRHACDLDIQSKYGVRYLTYWYHYGRPNAFCLIDAPTSDAALRVHQEAHGRLPSRIVEVNRESVTAFLGPIREPARGEAWEDVALRTVVCIASGEVEPAMDPIALPSRSRLARNLESRGGHEVGLREGTMISRFASTSAALECALGVQGSFAPLATVLEERSVEVRIGIHRSEPLTHYLDFFGEAVETASTLCKQAAPGEILVSREIRDACADLGFLFTAKGEALTGDGRTEVVFRLERRETVPERVPAPGSAPGALSPRELEVLQLIAMGKTNQEIANALFISLNTVATHVRSIFYKTQTANRAEAAIYALRHRLI